jgi:hypothetical protein
MHLLQLPLRVEVYGRSRLRRQGTGTANLAPRLIRKWRQPLAPGSVVKGRTGILRLLGRPVSSPGIAGSLGAPVRCGRLVPVRVASTAVSSAMILAFWAFIAQE